LPAGRLSSATPRPPPPEAKLQSFSKKRKDRMIEKRYSRNIGTIGEDGQRRLRGSHAAVAGAGGLGGAVFEILCRMGVGRITVIDCDSFEPTNLNRQLLATEKTIGKNKAEAAAKRAHEINPDVKVAAVKERISEKNAKAILEGARLACDCLGNIRDRFALERAARSLGIPMVHAAVAGNHGQIITVFPDSAGLEAIYGPAGSAPDSGLELELGTPAASVVAVAALAAHEVIKILSGCGEPLRNEILRLDLDACEMRRFELPSFS
jgi:molybdopterin/thiamine biosynthesis adenylyltransferase